MTNSRIQVDNIYNIKIIIFLFIPSEGGLLMTGGSKSTIVVSTIKEAEFFASGGFDDILYASLFTEDKIKRFDNEKYNFNLWMTGSEGNKRYDKI